jgi:hypothetical protein
MPSGIFDAQVCQLGVSSPCRVTLGFVLVGGRDNAERVLDAAIVTELGRSYPSLLDCNLMPSVYAEYA